MTFNDFIKHIIGLVRRVWSTSNADSVNYIELYDELSKLDPTNNDLDRNRIIQWAAKVQVILKKLPEHKHYDDFCIRYRVFDSVAVDEGTIKDYRSHLEKIYFDVLAELEEKTKGMMHDKHYDSNSFLDAQKDLRKIISEASESVWIQDRYLDHLIIELLTSSKATDIKILTSKPKESFTTRLLAAKKQLDDKKISVKKSNKFHDRYVFIDEKYIWTISGSINEDLGKNSFHIVTIKNDGAKVRKIDGFKSLWKIAAEFNPR